MKLFIDAVGIRMSGSVTVMENLLHSLLTVDENIYLTVFILPPKDREYEATVIHPRIRYIEIAFASGMAGRVLWQQIRLPLLCRKERADTVIVFTNIGAIIPTAPQIVYYHQALFFTNDIHIKYPLKERLRQIITKWFAVKGMKSSHYVATQTETMRKAIAENINIDDKKIATIHAGIPRIFKGTGESSLSRQQEWSQLLKKMKNGKTLFYLSHPGEYKNFEILIKGLALLKKEGINLQLALTVDTGYRKNKRYSMLADKYMSQINFFQLEDRIIWLGNIPRQLVREFIEASSFFVFPSLVESFPQPLAEGMSSGALMLVADRPYAREICGEAAIYFNPFSYMDFSQKIKLLLADKEKTAQLRNYAKERANFFSYNTAAQKLLELASQSIRQI